MLGFFVRTVGCLVLAAGTAFAIGDIARSLSAEQLRLTSVGEAANLLSGGEWGGPASLATAPFGAESIWSVVSQWPVSPTLAVIAILVLLMARRREHRSHSI